MTDSIFATDNLTVRFDTPEGQVRAVNEVSFAINSGETLAIVGESGSGKSQTFLAIMGLLARNGTATGTAYLDGTDLLSLTASKLDKHRGKDIAMVFQDPMTALNPSLRVSRQLTETLEVHQGLSREAASRRAIDMLTMLGIPDPERRFFMYPHELSGGMRQRVMIAMALLCEPKLLIADEPTTALDVTIQAQILDLFAELKSRLKIALVLITHDLGVVAGLADRVIVMYAGRIVESASVNALFADPLHPYTKALLASTPRVDVDMDGLTSIPGQPPNMQRVPKGCPFHPRCRDRMDRCLGETPLLVSAGMERKCACFKVDAETEQAA